MYIEKYVSILKYKKTHNFCNECFLESQSIKDGSKRWTLLQEVSY